jgi:ATP-dependent DNA helicase RecG
MAEADEAFLKLVLEEEARRGSQFPIDSLIILAALREQRRASSEQLAALIHKEAARTAGSVEALVEASLLQAHGVGRGRTYTLSPGLYRLLGEEAEYIQQASFDRLQQEQLVKNFVAEHGVITRKDVMRLCRLTSDQAYKLLKHLCNSGVFEKQGDRKGAVYVRR